jgi:hypothetical protein
MRRKAQNRGVMEMRNLKIDELEGVSGGYQVAPPHVISRARCTVETLSNGAVRTGNCVPVCPFCDCGLPDCGMGM